MRRLGLLRGVVFALIAGLGVLFWSLVVGTWLDNDANR